MSWADDEVSQTRYVFGSTRELSVTDDIFDDPSTLIIAAVTPTPEGGWRCRSTRRDVLNDDYDAKLHPNFNEVHKWIQLDLGRNYVTRDREEALGSLADLLSSQSLHSYLHLPSHIDPFEGAERALRSLELVAP